MNRKFNDRPSGTQIPDESLPHDYLTRVACINVLSAAKCGFDQAPVAELSVKNNENVQ